MNTKASTRKINIHWIIVIFFFYQIITISSSNSTHLEHERYKIESHIVNLIDGAVSSGIVIQSAGDLGESQSNRGEKPIQDQNSWYFNDLLKKSELQNSSISALQCVLNHRQKILERSIKESQGPVLIPLERELFEISIFVLNGIALPCNIVVPIVDLIRRRRQTWHRRGDSASPPQLDWLLPMERELRAEISLRLAAMAARFGDFTLVRLLRPYSAASWKGDLAEFVDAHLEIDDGKIESGLARLWALSQSVSEVGHFAAVTFGKRASPEEFDMNAEQWVSLIDYLSALTRLNAGTAFGISAESSLNRVVNIFDGSVIAVDYLKKSYSRNQFDSSDFIPFVTRPPLKRASHVESAMEPEGSNIIPEIYKGLRMHESVIENSDQSRIELEELLSRLDNEGGDAERQKEFIKESQKLIHSDDSNEILLPIVTLESQRHTYDSELSTDLAQKPGNQTLIGIDIDATFSASPLYESIFLTEDAPILFESHAHANFHLFEYIDQLISTTDEKFLIQEQ